MKDNLITTLLIMVGMICVTGSCLLICFPSFIIFLCLTFYWLSETKHGKKFIEIVCGKEF